MHAVGSIIAIEDNKFMVCGYRPIEQDGAVSMGYLLLPYPLGFMSVDNFSLIPSDMDFPTVFEGFRNEDAEQLDATLEMVREAGKNTTMDEVSAAIRERLAELDTLRDAKRATIQDEEA